MSARSLDLGEADGILDLALTRDSSAGDSEKGIEPEFFETQKRAVEQVIACIELLFLDEYKLPEVRRLIDLVVYSYQIPRRLRRGPKHCFGSRACPGVWYQQGLARCGDSFFKS